MEMNTMAKNKRKDFLLKYGVPIALMATILLIQAMNPERKLLSYANLSLILFQSAVLGLVALGLALIMISGETDMSIAGIIGLIGCTFCYAIEVAGCSPFIAVVLALAVGVGFGIIEGLLITKMKISSFVATVTIMFVGKGLEKLYNDGRTVWLTNEDVISVGGITFIGIPLLAWLFIFCYILWFIIINKTKFGFRMRVTGENEQAAQEVGIRTKNIKIVVFVFAGLLYTIGAIIEPIRTTGAIIYAGDAYLLPAMSACFLGSTMFVPGRVNVLGTMVGVLFMSVITNFLTMLNVPYYIVPLVQGVLLLASVILANINNREIKQNKL